MLKNNINLCGTLGNDLDTRTSANGKTVYHGTINVTRKSGTVDELPFMLFADNTPNLKPYDLVGKRVCVTGSLKTIRRKDNTDGPKSKVVVYVNVMYPASENVAEDQSVVLEGKICKAPVYRATPFGRHICELVVACETGKYAENVPVISWGAQALKIAGAAIGDTVSVSGRFQSRKYEKKLDAVRDENGYPVKVWRTTYEVSAKVCDVVQTKEATHA